MKKLLTILACGGVLLLSQGCDDKEKAKYVAQSTYNELESQLNQLKLKNQQLIQKNRRLQNENEILQHDLAKYKDGFKSMYE